MRKLIAGAAILVAASCGASKPNPPAEPTFPPTLPPPAVTPSTVLGVECNLGSGNFITDIHEVIVNDWWKFCHNQHHGGR